jgi:AhpD family alkylhydroperoxidase
MRRLRRLNGKRARLNTEDKAMRLSAIEHPDGLYLKVAYAVSRRRFGRVVTPLKLVYSRVPSALRVSLAVTKFLSRGVGLEKDLVFMIETYVAGLNGCGFCVDIARSMAMRERIDLDKLEGLAEFRTDARFTARERAALAYVDAITRHRHVDDDTFATLQEHFSDREIVEITLINASENYYNLINAPLGIESDGLCALVKRPSAATRVATPAGE